MPRFRPLILLLLSLPACHSTGQDPTLATEEVRTATFAPSYLSASDLSIWIGVDTLEAINAEAIAVLREFFERKLISDDISTYWVSSDPAPGKLAFQDIVYVEYDEQGDLKYFPTLMNITKVNDRERLLTVKWAATDSTGTAADVRYVFDFLAGHTDQGIRLERPLDHNTRSWQREDLGDLHYIISPEHPFNKEQAREQANDIQRLSHFFGIAPFPISFYSCKDPTDLFKMRGFQLHPLMYVHETGGLADFGDRIFSGNDRDIYTHEVVHLFAMRKFPDERSDLLNEGIATFLAGSSGKPYAWHRSNLRRYLKAKPDLDPEVYLDPYQQLFIDTDTNVPYAIGAVICEHILRKAGKEGLFNVLASGADPWPMLAEFGVQKAEIGALIRHELELPILVLE